MSHSSKNRKASALVSVAFASVLAVSGDAQAQVRPGTTTPTTPASPTTSAPAGTTGQQTRPGALPPGQTQLPPNAGSTTISPANEAQQSTQPQSNIQQQRQGTTPQTAGPQPTTPQITTPGQTSPADAGSPATANPVGTIGGAAPAAGAATTPGAAAVTGGVPATPGQNVGTSGVAPAELPQEPPAIAPGYEAPVRDLPSAERVGVLLDQQTPLSLNDAIRLAIENNNDLESARTDVRIAEFDLTSARGVFDPIISSENFYERSTTPVSSIIGGGANGSVTQTNATGALRFGGFSPFAGGSYQADFSSTRLVTNNRLVSLNPQFPSALTLTYTQPILRGRRFDQNRRQIEIAKRNLSLTDAQFRQRAIDIVAQVTSSYWDLAFALRNLQVQIDAVRQARVQVESNRRLVQQGVLAPIDLVAADAQVTTFEQSVYTAQEAVTRSENALKTLLLRDRSNELWSRPLVPVTPVDLAAPRDVLGDAVTAALQNRPELEQIRTSQAINSIDARFFREQTRPRIDLVGTYNPVGLAGTFVPRDNNLFNTGTTTGSTTADIITRVNELAALSGANLTPLAPQTTTSTGSTINENLVGGYGSSLANLIGQNYPTFRVGVRVEIPFRNRTAQANLGRSLAAGTQIDSLLRQTEQIIEADVRNNLQTVRSSEARLASAAASRSSAEQQYASEQRQFAAGTSTLFLVLQRQTELIAARGRELQAQTDLNKAITLFQRATGTTLTVNNVALQLDTPLRALDIDANRTRAASGRDGERDAAAAPPAAANSFAPATNSVVLTPVIRDNASGVEPKEKPGANGVDTSKPQTAISFDGIEASDSPATPARGSRP